MKTIELTVICLATLIFAQATCGEEAYQVTRLKQKLKAKLVQVGTNGLRKE